MNSGAFIAIYIPIIFVLLQQANIKRMLLFIKMKRKKGEHKMTNELIQSCVGLTCTISTGSFGASYAKVKVVEVKENWIKIEKNGKVNIINSDYIQNIKIV